MSYDEEVAQLNRELRYFPLKNDSPKKLSDEQIQFFNEKGYIKGFEIFNKEKADENRKNFDSILEKFLNSGKGSYAIDRYQDRIKEIWDLANNSKIVSYVTDLLGSNVVCWATHYFCKLPGDDKGVAWHQDCTYWPVTPSKTITVWLAIDDADFENGCMQFIPGSHVHGLIEPRKSNASEKNVLSLTVDDPGKYGEQPVDVELKAGRISIHSDLLLHGSLPNKSDRRRCGLTLRYAPVDVRAYWDWNKHSIIVSGEDPSGHWANIPRPGDDFEIRED